MQRVIFQKGGGATCAQRQFARNYQDVRRKENERGHKKAYLKGPEGKKSVCRTSFRGVKVDPLLQCFNYYPTVRKDVKKGRVAPPFPFIHVRSTGWSHPCEGHGLGVEEGAGA